MTRAHEPQHGSLQNSRPATPAETIMELERLSLPYHRPDMTEGKWRVLFLTFCEDLKGKTLPQIQMACRRWRQNPGNKFYPTPGQLIELCAAPFADRPGKSQGRQTERGFQPWGGACQCERCLKQLPSEGGFYRAPAFDHQRDGLIRDGFAYDMERKLGYDAKVGNPALDDTIERQRSPEELKAALATARARYPRVFNPGQAEFAGDRAPTPYTPSPPELVAKAKALVAQYRSEVS